jgi:hypothetical protein
MMIQCVYRSYRAVKIRKILRIYQANIKKLRLEATIRIQRKVRVIRTRNIIQVIQDARRFRLNSSIKIQSLMRGYLTRLHFAEMQAYSEESKLNKAAVKIQTRIRMFFAVREVTRKLICVIDQQKNNSVAASTIVRQCRIKLAYLAFKRKKEE